MQGSVDKAPRGDRHKRLFVGLRMPREIHPYAVEAAAAEHRSLANWVLQLVYDAIEERKKQDQKAAE